MTEATVLVVLLGLAAVCGLLFATPPAARFAWRLGGGGALPGWLRPIDRLLDRAGRRISNFGRPLGHRAVMPPLPPVADGDVFFEDEPAPRLQS